MFALSNCDLQHALRWCSAEYKWLEWESTHPSLRPWFSAGKWQIGLFRLGTSHCPKWRSLSTISGSCWRVRVKWSAKSKAVMRALYQTIVVKRELSRKAKLSMHPIGDMVHLHLVHLVGDSGAAPTCWMNLQTDKTSFTGWITDDNVNAYR